MKNGLFHFKRFSVSHAGSSMKVGVDGVLIGAWASCGGQRLLDVGCGCGLIALMLAQRNMEAFVDAIDIDEGSVDEATSNFSMSGWGERLRCRRMAFKELTNENTEKYDVIVSNPPFYDSGVKDLSSARAAARHKGELSPETLLEDSGGLLSDIGRVAMIFPADYLHGIREIAGANGFTLERASFVRNHLTAPIKRVMVEFRRSDGVLGEILKDEDIPVLTMFEKDGSPTPDYRKLTGDFYLKF